MPAVKKQPRVTESTAAPPEGNDKPAPATSAKEKERKIVHPEILVELAFGDEAITMQRMKELLWWEDEDEYKARTGSDKGFGEPDFVDMWGKKVRCWRNRKNREFREKDARKYGQDVLNRNWAGPTCMPGETVNGESFIVSRYDDVLSGQHRGIGFIFACQIWAGAGPSNQSEHWKTLWPTEPVLDTIVVYGVSDDPRILRSLDNVVTRTEADVIQTSDIFAAVKDRSKRAELSRMMAKANDMLWKRTGAADDPFHKYQTHSESVAFIERHGRLKKCVTFLFEANSPEAGRGISLGKLSPGQCAALMYLMGSSKSDPDEYRNREPRDEKKLDWSLWDKAAEFWQEMAKLWCKKGGDSAKQAPSARNCKLWEVRQAFAALQNDKGEDVSTWEEKSAIICHAWHAFKTTGKVEAADLQVEYTPPDKDGLKHLDDFPNVGGIDEGEKPKKVSVDEETGEELTPEAMEAAKEAAKKATEEEELRREAAEESKRKVAELRAKTPPVPKKPPLPKSLLGDKKK